MEDRYRRRTLLLLVWAARRRWRDMIRMPASLPNVDSLATE
jgi:hypothetical protein